MNRVLIGIYGASGFGKEVYPLVRGSIEQDPNVDLCFIDDGSKLSQLLGLRGWLNIMSFCNIDF